MKKVVLACILGLVLTFAIAPAVFAHTHIELPNGECITIPGHAYDQDNQAQNSHFGIAVASGSTRGGPYPGNADAPPLIGGLCD